MHDHSQQVLYNLEIVQSTQVAHVSSISADYKISENESTSSTSSCHQGESTCSCHQGESAQRKCEQKSIFQAMHY